MMAMLFSKKRNIISEEKFKANVIELTRIPEKIEEILKRNGEIKKIAKLYKNVTNCLYLGRGYLFQ